MASFDITAQINLRGPTNVRKIAADIRRQLGNIKSSVDLKIDTKTIQNVANINKNFRNLNTTLAATKGNLAAVNKAFLQLNRSVSGLGANTSKASQNLQKVTTSAKSATQATQQLNKAARNTGDGFKKLGSDLADQTRKFAILRVVTGTLGGVANAIRDGAAAYVEYERELAKVQQVTGATDQGLRNLSKGIQDAATATGAAATELAKVSVVLSQAGLSARETNEALQTLAKTTLAPTFGDITETTEGAIAVLRQFKLETSDLEQALGSINAVAGAFAVSAADIIVAVKQAGAVFASSSQGVSEGTDALNEFIAVFTSVRQTTRESAETIGTGLKTIVTRLQRLDTIQSLKQFGIQLTDLEGKFVGPFEAIKRLNEGLQAFDPRDVRFGAIIEELGGFRQVGKVIPLIQQFAVAQEALNVARQGGNSITDQQIIAQQTLSVQVKQLTAEFQKLITNVSESSDIKRLASFFISAAKAAVQLVDALKDVLPVLAAIGSSVAIPALAGLAKGFVGRAFGANQGGMVPHHFASGGYVPGRGDKDTVPAMLTPGEFVIRKKAVQAIGVDSLGAMNNGASPAVAQAKANGGMIQYFKQGGTVSVDYATKKPNPSEERKLIGNNIVNSVNSLADYYDPSAKQYNSRKSPKNIANYNGIVGGIFESAVELVAGNSNKQKNEAVWDYPTGIGDTSLFNNVPGKGIPTDAKKSASTATVRKKLKAHYRNAKGTDLNRTKFGIVAFGKGDDYEYDFDVDQIKSEVAGQRASAIKAQGKNRGGLIQFFEDGGSVLPITGTGKVTQKNLANASIADLEATLKSPKLSAAGRATVQSTLDQSKAAASAKNIAVVGILPLGYSKDYPAANFGGTLAKLHARGLPESKANIVKSISTGLQGVVSNVAQGLAGRSQLLTAEQEKATGLENVQGTVFEAVLSSLGAVGGTVQNQALDYRDGLGPAASLYKGIGPTWPTEVKRDVTGSGLTRAKGEFARYFKEMSQGKNLGGMIQKFAEGGEAGDTVPAMLTPGEFVLNKKAAKRIGIPKLNQLNHAEKAQGFAKGGPVGGIQYFTNGGGPDNNPFLNTGGAMGAQAAKTQAQAAQTQAKAAKTNQQAANQQEDASEEFSTRAQILLAFIGPAIEQAITRAFPNSEFGAGVGEGVQQGAATFQTVDLGIKTASKFLGKFGRGLGKLSKPIAIAAAAFSAFSGFNSGSARKSIELLSKEIDDGAKDTAKALKAFNDRLLDPDSSAKDLAKSLDEAASTIADEGVLRRQSAVEQTAQLQPGFLARNIPSIFGESEDDKKLRGARERTIETEAFQQGADDALKALEDALNKGENLGDIFDQMADEGESLKKAIAFQDKATRENIEALERQRDSLEEGTPEREALNQQIKVAIDTGYLENAQRLKTIAKLKEAERAVEENKRVLQQTASSLSKYVNAFGTALNIAATNFEIASREAKAYAEGFAGVDTSDLLQNNITVLENPSAFNASEQAVALDPLKGILGDNARVFEALVQLPDRLEGAITSAAIGAAGEDSENVGRAISAAIKNNLGEFEGTRLGDSLSNSLTAAIEKATKGSQGTADTQAIIDQSTEIVKKVSEDFTKAAVQALQFIQKAGTVVSGFAQQSQVAFNKFNTGLLQASQSSVALSQDIERMLGTQGNQPRSIGDINARTTGAARSEVSGVNEFIQQNAELQKQLVDLEAASYQALLDGNAAFSENATEIGRVKGEIIGLRQQTENLKGALTSKLGELKSELGNRLAQLKEQSAASQSLIDGLLTDEGGTNQRVDAAVKLASGDASGINSGDQALKVLKDIKEFQKAGIIPDDPKIIETAYRNALKATGINLNARGEKIFRQAFEQPSEDDQVQEYVKELQQTNKEINQLTNVLNLTELQNSNDALIASQDALKKSIDDMPKTIETISQKLAEQGLNSPIEVLEAGNIEVKNAGKVDIRDTLGAEKAPAQKARGGIIYRAEGGEGIPSVSDGINWSPRGSDTVPAMLTPGEYVVNKKATQANRGLLEQINSGSGRKIKPIYRAEGGPSDGSVFSVDYWKDFFDKATDFNTGTYSQVFANWHSSQWNQTRDFSSFFKSFYGNLIKNKPFNFTNSAAGGWLDSLQTWSAKAADKVKFSDKGFFKWFKSTPAATGSAVAPALQQGGSAGAFSGNAVNNLMKAKPETWLTKAFKTMPTFGKWIEGGYNRLPKGLNLQSISGWISKSPTFQKLLTYAGPAAKIGGFAAYAGSSILGGVNRYEEAQNDPNAFNPFLSGLMTTLAGGAGAPPTDGYLWGAVGNIGALINSIITGYQVAGPPGAVAFAAANVVGQLGRTAEELWGLYKDYGASNASFDALLDQAASTTANFKLSEDDRSQQAGATTNLGDQIDILGPLQINRAKTKGKLLADYEWYNRKDNPFYDLLEKSGIDAKPKSRNFANSITGYWDGKVDGTSNSAFSSLNKIQTFDPNLIPDDQKASFSSGDIFNNKYSDAEITKAYEQVAAEQQKRQAAYLGDQGLPIGDYPNVEGNQPVVAPTSHANLIANLKDQANAIFNRTRGVEGADGVRDPDSIQMASAYQKDQELLQIDDALGSIVNEAVGYFNSYPTDQTSRDRTGFNTSTDYLNRVNEQAIAFDKREEELLELTRKRQQEERDADAGKKKARADANAQQAKNFVNGIGVFADRSNSPLIPDEPYVNIEDYVYNLQKDSISMRQQLNDLPLGDGPSLKNYVDFAYGKLGSEANTLLKDQSSIDIAQNIANAVAQYRENYVQGSPIYGLAKNRFKDSINAWEDQQKEPVIAQAIRRSLFSGDSKVDFTNKEITEALTGTAVPDQKNAADATDIAAQMGYEGGLIEQLANYSKDDAEAREGKPDQQTADKFKKQQQAAIKAVLARRQQDRISALSNDDQIVASLIQTVSRELPVLDGIVTGANFYRSGDVNNPLAAGSEGDLALGYKAMAGKIGGQLIPELNAGQTLPGDSGKLDFAKTYLYYVRRLNEAQQLSNTSTPLEREQRAETVADEQAAAAAARGAEAKRFKRVVSYGQSLQSQNIPTMPLDWLEWRQDQNAKFAGIADDTNTSPRYPDARDIPAFTKAGISDTWVRGAFDLSGGLGDNVTPEGARELLRWKAGRNGDNAQELLALAERVGDGNVGFNDIYPASITGGDASGTAAAKDLQAIYSETGKFQNVVLGRENLAVGLLKKNLERMFNAGLWNPERGLEGNVTALGHLDERLDSKSIQKRLKQFTGKTEYYNEGGAVFTPRGTDTVPAMLTPGEYIVNRKAAAQNRPLLDAINGGRGTQSRRKGYYNDGGDVNGNGVNNITVDTTEISKFITSFDRFAKELAALNVPEQITIQGTHTVEVNVNGAQVLNDLLTGPLGELVRTEIAGAFELQNQDSEGAVPNPFNPATNT